MDPTQCINFLLTDAQNSVNLYFKEMLKQFDVTPAQYMVLYFLKSQGRLTPSGLSQLCKMDASTMTGILTRMEKKNLLERQHSTEDRRQVDICITKSGEMIVPDILEVIEQSNIETLSCLSPHEQVQFKKYLTRISNHLESHE
ncbi:MarR family winged helix-turn-helix transcriptional regulator [Youngiibacter fragilis]|uniref:MarR family transcriptional regulator n=1 Tax=Youngiibacter fragilis 232.1 TaxID=994573 RepID=V4FD90_9CLOT|nr:MarR family transcriptional regulator [Youngiibacter fragilis]ETA81048.1 MarR family transcriptional regulator [Youngiibacter fragilis 232.1]